MLVSSMDLILVCFFLIQAKLADLPNFPAKSGKFCQN